MLLKIIYSLGVLVISIIVCTIIGSLMVLVDQATIQTVGAFLKDNAGLIGVLCAVCYFIWGYRPVIRR